MHTKKQTGFTIVELLIVIVVIGILAAITIVAFNGIQNRANNTTIQSDLATMSKSLELHKIDTDSFPKSQTELSAMKTDGKYLLKPTRTAYSTDNNLLYCFTADGSNYALVSISKSGTAYTISNTNKKPTVFTGYTGSAGTTCPNTATGSGTSGAWGYAVNGSGVMTWFSWVS